MKCSDPSGCSVQVLGISLTGNECSPFLPKDPLDLSHRDYRVFAWPVIVCILPVCMWEGAQLMARLRYLPGISEGLLESHHNCEVNDVKGCGIQSHFRVFRKYRALSESLILLTV